MEKQRMNKINILGSEWTIEKRKREDDPNLGAYDGYADTSIRKIIVEDMVKEQGGKADLSEYTKQVLRHEIIHAFLFESGLEANSLCFERGWATNEEMVDWFALQSPKLMKAFKEADAV